MSALFSSNKRVVSGMRVSGRLHLGHYHGVIKIGLNYNINMIASFLQLIGMV